MSQPPRSRDLFLVNVTVFLDVLGYSIMLPVIPFLVKELKGDSLQTGMLFSGYALAQLFSYMIMGYVSDKVGRKPLMIISMAGICIGSIIQGCSRSVWFLIISRTITGLFAGCWIVAEAYIADCTTEDARPKFIARLEAFLAGAYVFGPGIGALLAHVGHYSTPLFASGAVAGLTCLLVTIVMRESLSNPIPMRDLFKKKVPTTEEALIPHEKVKFYAPKGTVKRSIFDISILSMGVEFFNRWTINAWDCNFALFANEKFGMEEEIFALLVICLGLVSCVLNSVIQPFLVYKCGVGIPEMSMIGGVCQCLSFLLTASPWLCASLFGCVFLEIGYSLSSPAPASIISSFTSHEIQGEVLSYNMICGQVAMVLAPLVVGYLYEVRRELPYIVSSVAGVFVTIFMSIIMSFPGGRLAGRISAEEAEVLFASSGMQGSVSYRTLKILETNTYVHSPLLSETESTKVKALARQLSQKALSSTTEASECVMDGERGSDSLSRISMTSEMSRDVVDTVSIAV